MPPKATLTGIQVVLMVLQVVLSATTVWYLVTYVSGARRVQEQQQCQIAINAQFRAGRLALSDAQTDYNKADRVFVIADARFVDAQDTYLRIVSDRSQPVIVRDAALATYQAAIHDKEQSSKVKLAALDTLEQRRADPRADPLPPPGC